MRKQTAAPGTRAAAVAGTSNGTSLDATDLGAERATLLAEHTRRAAQLAAVAREGGEAEQHCAALGQQREKLRLAALVEKDPDAVAALAALTQEATAASMRREDLAAVRSALEAQLAKIAGLLSAAEYRVGMATLRVMQEERQALALALDEKIAELAEVLGRYSQHAREMSMRAFAHGVQAASRLYEPQAAMGAILSRIDPDSPVTRSLHAIYRRPLATQIAGWTFPDCEPPANWRTPVTAAAPAARQTEPTHNAPASAVA